MKCVMCPRTIYMTEKNIWIDDNLFERMLDNIKTHKKEKLDKFWNWLKKAKFNLGNIRKWFLFFYSIQMFNSSWIWRTISR